MQLKKTAIAGTMESSDIQIMLTPNPGNGLKIHLNSVVRAQFGDAISETVDAVLKEFDVTDAIVQIEDKGAFDWVIRARLQAAICRAADIEFNWKDVK